MFLTYNAFTAIRYVTLWPLPLTIWSWPSTSLWRGTVVARRSLASELSLSCARLAWSDAVIWVNCPLQVNQLGQLSLSSFRGWWMSSKLQSDVRSGGAIWWMLTGWRPGVVDWGGDVIASFCRGSNCSLARAIDGRISAAAPLALADQLPLLMTVKRGWSGFPVRHAI